MLLGLHIILFCIQFLLIKCSIHTGPDELAVQMVDEKMIEKKREDTREMCRIFNSASLKAALAEEGLPFSNYDQNELSLKEKSKGYNKIGGRRKRDIKSVNPALNADDEARVEKIVDKLYDDLLEKGHKIPYKRKELPKVVKKVEAEVNSNSTLNIQKETNKTARRFPFAPAIMEGPTTQKPTTKGPIFNTKIPRFPQAIVPFFIDSRTYDTHLTEKILKAFDYFEKATCVRLQRLRERPIDKQSLQNVVWLYITNPSGIRQCVHSNDKAEIKGVQMIVFGYDCMSLGDIAHEIMHVLGFSHEHTRPDRDQYVSVLWDNIKAGYRKYFELQDTPLEQNLPYDYASVLHYPARAFSRNGQATILTEPNIKIGQREGLSEMDVKKVTMVYSDECVKRNRDYLLKTCPSVVRSQKAKPTPVTQEAIEEYFEQRIWPYGIVNFQFRDALEFSAEELDNIYAVIRHIEKETCIEFRKLDDLTIDDIDDADDSSKGEANNINNKDNTSTQEKNDSETETETGIKTETGTNKIPDIDTALNQPIPKDGVVTKSTYGFPWFDATTPAHPVKSCNYKHPKSAYSGNKMAQILGTKAKKNRKFVSKINEKKKKKSIKRRKRAIPVSPSRRHVTHVIEFTRSPQPGCQCPHPGKPEGKYVLDINADCFNSVNDLLHLFVHVLGLDHQHNMHDRDEYLHIVWDQLTDDVRQEMSTKLAPAASVGFPYDYQSVMHYPWLQIKNGKTNMMYPIWNDGWAMGHWQGLSSTDVQKINLLYFRQCVERRHEAEYSLRNKKKNN